VGLIGEDGDGDYILAMLDQYHVNRQRVQRTLRLTPCRR
jgi:sugar/nucleoside kinase (ribokinase family)